PLKKRLAMALWLVWTSFRGQLRRGRRFVMFGRETARLKQAVDAFVKETDARPLKNIASQEYAIRGSQYEYGPYPFGALQQLSHLYNVVPWYDLFAWSGYRREAALKAVKAAAPNPFLFAIVTRKLNDWVPQVRAAAAECVTRCAAVSPPSLVAEAMWALTPELYKWGRMDPEGIAAFEALATTPGVRDALLEMFLERPIGPGARVLRRLIRQPGWEEVLPSLQSNACQPAVRATALTMLYRREARWETGWTYEWTQKPFGEKRRVRTFQTRALVTEADKAALLQGALTDRSPMVRKAAGDLLIQDRRSLGADAQKIAARMAVDANPAVAERGRYVLNNPV
ncbi:MAG: hypothetical protein AAF337_13820, partial [Pseudomonadota bacterium]